MAVLQAFVFVAIGVVLLLITLVALLRIAALRVESSLGRSRDGLARGDIAPAWRLSDRDGVPHQVPSSAGWQVLVFVNQWIVAFPDLARELGRTRHEFPDVEFLVVTKADADVAATGLREVGLEIPLIEVSDRFYKLHNVWVMPHVLVLGRHGRVLASGNVADGPLLRSMWRYAQLIDTHDSIATAEIESVT